MRIAFMNNYDTLRHERQWREAPDRYPSHHLWGVPHLRRLGYAVEILPYADDDTRRTFGGHVGLLGDSVQQRLVLRNRRSLDLVYSGHQNSALGLAAMRRLGLFDVPLVGVLHRSYAPGLKSRAFVRTVLAGYDRLLVFSDGVRRAIHADFGLPLDRLSVIDWGMDLRAADWTPPDPASGAGAFVLSVGKTFRDFPTMIAGHRATGVPLRAIGWSSVDDPRGERLPPWIAVEGTAVPWPDLAPLYRACLAVAIPVDPARARAPANTCGLTSLLDAMAFGRAVIMTRVNGQAVDVEAEGIGLHVEPGDAEGWAAAVARLRDDPAATAAMGRRARRLAETRFNIDRFGRTLADVVCDLLPARRGAPGPSRVIPRSAADAADRTREHAQVGHAP
jgi:glycosyltransferase involved in cell wall biosynthesis